MNEFKIGDRAHIKASSEMFFTDRAEQNLGVLAKLRIEHEGRGFSYQFVTDDRKFNFPVYLDEIEDVSNG